MKKILMLNSMSFLPFQGRYLRIYNEAKTLAEAGYEVTLLAWDRECSSPRSEIIDGIRVERIALKSEMVKGPRNIHKHLLFNYRLMQKLLRSPLDVVHCFNLDTVLAGLLVGKARRKKVVLDLCEPNYYMYWPDRNLIFARMIGALERIVAPLFDTVLVHNLYQMRKFRQYGVNRLVQISSVPDLQQPFSGERDWRGEKHWVLGRIGTVYPDSGIEETIEAMKRLVKRGNPVRLLFAGKVLESYEGRFRELLEPIREHVDCVGSFDISRMPDLYKGVDLSIQIHKRTLWFQNITPTKFFESLANGVPVIASDIGDYKELMQGHSCGIVVDENDPEGVCRAIEEILREPARIQAMREGGLRLIREEYNWGVMRERLLRVYDVM